MLWIWYLMLLGVLLTGWFINILGLPGIWFMIASCAVYGWWTGWQLIGLWTLAVMVLIGVIAEIVEFVAGAAGARKVGGSKRSTAGAIIGGVVGAIALSIPVPILGTILGACIGAFIGAWMAEYTVEGNLDRSTQVGIGAAKGKFWGILSKLVFSFIILVLAAWFGAPFPSRIPALPPVIPPPSEPVEIAPERAGGTLPPCPTRAFLV